MSEKTNAPYLRNAWWQAAWSEELADGKLARTIMDEPIVIFRDKDGNIGAIEDRCCHRGAPLSHGTITDKGLECLYHGLTFNTAGKCVDIPGQDSIPPAACVRNYPVVERQQFIWIWMGDPARADEAKILDWPFHDMPDKYPHRKAMMPLASNYMMMIDNLMDLTHLGYVHRKTIGGDPKTHVEAKMDTSRTDTGVKYIRWMENANPPPTYVKGAGFKGKVDRWQEFEYVLPGSVLQWSGALDIGKDARDNREQEGFHLRLFHGITPATATTSYYFWSAANGYRQDDPQATEDMYNEIYPTFVEDVEIMEVQQQRINLDPDRPLLGIKADIALVQARRALKEALEQDQPLSQAAE